MIAIVDYQAGNIGSVANALKRLGVNYQVTDDIEAIKSSNGVIFPGQGRAGPAMKSLSIIGLDKALPKIKQPFLGICLGMQLMIDELDEDLQTGLGIIPGSCKKFQNIKPVPHMGWNSIQLVNESKLFEGISDNDYQYFVHSYFVQTPDEFAISTTEYGGRFVSAVNRDNFFGVQFHPEKSGQDGEKILLNFLKICGEK